MKLADRAKICRETLGLSQEKVAELLGISQPSYQRLEKGEVANPKQLNKLAEIYKTSPQWIKFGVGAAPAYLNTQSIPDGQVPIFEWHEVKHLSDVSNIEAYIKSHSFLESHAFKVDKSAVEEPLLKLEFISIPNKINSKQFALRVKGDSMVSPIPGRRSFLENDIIVIDLEKTPIDMDYVIALQEGSTEAIFKQYVIDGNNQFLRPLNPQYPLITLDKTIKICGVVVAHLDVLG